MRRMLTIICAAALAAALSVTAAGSADALGLGPVRLASVRTGAAADKALHKAQYRRSQGRRYGAPRYDRRGYRPGPGRGGRRYDRRRYRPRGYQGRPGYRPDYRPRRPQGRPRYGPGPGRRYPPSYGGRQNVRPGFKPLHRVAPSVRRFGRILGVNLRGRVYVFRILTPSGRVITMTRPAF